MELSPYLSRPRAPGSLGALLRADAALVEFAGREKEIGVLERWRDRPAISRPDVRAMLVTGRGGEGKTRLAVEFLARSRKEGWSGGILRSGFSLAAEIAGHSARRLLLVIDYAAAQSAESRAFIQALVRTRPQVPVRLLLLARAAGQWWQDLAAELEEELPGLKDEVLELRPLLAADNQTAGHQLDPATVFTQTVYSLAPHLASFTGHAPAELNEIAKRVQVSDFSRKNFEHALDVQMSALVALLQQCDYVAAAMPS